MTNTIVVSRYPETITIAPDGKHALVACALNVAVIDIATFKQSDSITVGKEPSGIAITPDSKYAIVSNVDNDNLSVIDITTLKALPNTIPVNHFPGTIKMTTDGRLAVLAYHYTENNEVTIL